MNDEMTIQKPTDNVFSEDVVGSAWWSPNLQKFLKKKPHFNRIYRDTETGIWWIGLTDGRFYAAGKFLAVLCNGTKTKTWAVSATMGNRFEDRTEQFWKCANYFGRRMFRKWYWG